MRTVLNHLYCHLVKTGFYFIIILILLPAISYSGDVGVDIYGISYHYDSITYYSYEKREWKQYNEINTGIGIQWIIIENKNHIFFAKAGIYKDSKSNQSKFIGPGYQYKLLENLHIGMGIALFDSDTYQIPVIPMPLLTYRYKFIRLNCLWWPTIAKTESGSFAFFLTITVWKN